MAANNANYKMPPNAFSAKTSWKKDFKQNWVLYLMFIPVLVFFIIFSYVPMFGIVMAFQDFSPTRGFFGSTFTGWENFQMLFSGTEFWIVIRNTSVMALLNLTIGYLFPVILALLISQVKVKWFKKTVQTVSYMPYFIAIVVVCSMLTNFVSAEGFITKIFMFFGMEEQNMLANPDYFWWINTFTEVWQGSGYGAIVFVSAIARIDMNLHEAAAIDGANRWRRMWHVTLPGILPVIITMFTLKVGLIFVTGFDKILLLYMPKTEITADVLTTYVFRRGIKQGDYGLAAAAGLFQSVIATALLLISNKLASVTAKTSLF